MKNTKKGFTLVELLVVIAIVAILAAVSVVGYTAFINNAHESNDRTLVVQLNKTLIGGEFDGPHDAFEAVRAAGFDVAKIDATANNQEILWDNEAKEFFYTADGSRTGDIWIVDDEVSKTYNTYYIGTANIDFADAAKIVVYTNDPELTISINAPQAHVEHEGKAGSINVIAVADNSYYENGLVSSLNVTTGKIVVNGTVATLKVVGAANVNVAEGSDIVNVIVNDAAATVKVDAAAVVGNVATENEEVLESLGTIVDGADDVIVGTVVDSSKLGDFAGGFGTKDFPYIIETAEQLANISKHYDTYNYYKVADGVTSLDLTGVGKINLHGSFDGNGVKFVNLTTALFQKVGYQNVAEDIKISNFEATINALDGSALVRNIFNSGNTTFENVTLHGYIEGQSNVGSFYKYGTANYDGVGANYTVTFVNANSDVALVCTSGNTMGGMLGHGFEGANNTLTINMDEKSGYIGKMYTTTGNDCRLVMAMCSHATYVLNGVETSTSDNKYASTKLNVVNPAEGADGYTVTPVEGAAKFVVYIDPQVTAYDENGEQIANKSGMTWSFVHAETEVSGTDAVNVLDLITSASIVNGTDHEYGYELKDGVLTIYSGRSDNYASGWIVLRVNQYDADGDLLAAGNLRVYTIPEPSSAE